MWTAVIPAWNEENRISKVLTRLSDLPLDKIVVIANGCTDNTLQEISRFEDSRLDLHIFAHKLGVDLPRAIGAKIALDYRARGVLFIDGDMTGASGNQLFKLMEGVEAGLDLALTNCYPFIPYRYYHAAIVSHYRAKLNRELGLFQKLGLASPTHGPHGVSEKFLKTVPLAELAIPPVALALAAHSRLQIRVAARLPGHQLESRLRGTKHEIMIFQTIIGDHLEALSLIKGQPRNRLHKGEQFLGYHPERRFDLLEAFSTL
ncbi:MAG: glycosyltransferase [Bacillota bacterium]